MMASWERGRPARTKPGTALDHLPHLDQPGTAPWVSFGLTAAVPADRVAACSIALKLSGGQRERMRAGRPRSQGNHCPLEGESQKVQTANILYIINRKHGLHIDRVSAEEDKPMPWKETCTMDQRMLFIVDYLSGGYTKKGLCRHYGISRPTGDKWIDRYRIHGPEGLDDLSRRPGCHPDTTAPEIVERIIETKLAHQSFGPKQVMDRLRALEPTRSGRLIARPGRSSSETIWCGKDASVGAFPRSRGPWSTATLRHRAGAPTSRAT